MFDYMESCRQCLPHILLASCVFTLEPERWTWPLGGSGAHAHPAVGHGLFLGVLRMLVPRTTQLLPRGECFHPLGMTIKKKNQKYLFYLFKRQKRRRKKIPTQPWFTPRMLAAWLRLEPGARNQELAGAVTTASQGPH